MAETEGRVRTSRAEGRKGRVSEGRVADQDELEVTESGVPTGGGAGCPTVCLDAEGRGRIAGVGGRSFESV